MTLTIELTPEEESAVKNLAEAEKRTPEDFTLSLLRRAIQRERNEASIALFQQWEREDRIRLETMSPEEIAAEDAQWDEIQRNIAQEGLRLRIPDVSDHD